MAALFSQVMEAPELVTACMAYQDGVQMAMYEDGDVAACSGHLSLLRLRRALRRKGKRSEGDVGSTSGAKPDASCSRSSSKASSTRSVEERISGNKEEEAGGGKHVSMLAGEGQADSDEDVLQLEDLRFSHLAVDWAAAQGHLAVVRSASQSAF